jgi:5-methylcytosine-specific restriction endonuclease McrA
MASRIEPDKRSKALQYYYDNIDRLRAVQRARAKERYYRDRAAKLAKNNAFKKAFPEKYKAVKKASNAKYNKRRFFFVRALGIISRTGFEQSTENLCAVLSRAWYKQRGRCAYTGKKLGRDAQVDHKVPLSKGGTNDPDNIHWVIPAANWVKHEMTHEQFLAVAQDIVAHINQNTPKGLKRATK